MGRRILAGAALLGCLLFSLPRPTMPASRAQIGAPSAGPDIIHSQADYGRMPIAFIPNRGQADARIDYYVQGKDTSIYFGREGLTFLLTKIPAGAAESRWIVKLDFVGADPGVKPVGLDATGTTVSYFRGAPKEWKGGIPSFSRILYENLWPGIDLIYKGTMDALKYEFIVHPGADPARIRLAYRGASTVRVDARGRLAVATPAGGFEDGQPVAYQEDAGQRVNIPIEYAFAASTPDGAKDALGRRDAADSALYGFALGAYDRTKPLVLDPTILVYCGYIGGPNFDYGYGIAVDKKGCAYITGYTSSVNPGFPVTVGPDLSFNRGSLDAFVAKVNAAGTALDYCGFIGGAGEDYAYGIAVDQSGSATVTGYTSSTETSFPVKTGPDLVHNGNFDVFVAKVNAAGTALDYCGYIGGSGQDYGRAIAVDASGNAYVTGSTKSTEASFPVEAGPDSSANGDDDAFVAKITADGRALAYCGFIGGSGPDQGRGIAVDAAGNAYITGSTKSTETSFPVLTGPDTSANGDTDAFVTKVNPDGTEIVFSGFIGGTAEDVATGIGVDEADYAYVVGYTASDENTFPVYMGPDLSHNAGYHDAFVAKVNLAGLALEYCGYIGGSAYDAGTGIAVDKWGYAYVSGYTASSEDTFPVTEGPVLTHGGGFDAFVAKVYTTGTKLMYCSYIGGAAADLGQGVAIDESGSGHVFLTGNAFSTETSFPVLAGPGLVHSGNRDGFAAKISETSIVVLSPNGGETFHSGLTSDITWRTFGKVGKVKIEYSTDAGETWADVTASTENDGIYTWLVPDAASTSCQVRVSEAEDGDPSDVTDIDFEITNAGIIVVLSPNGGESWAVGSTHTLTWLSANFGGDVAIEYSTDYNDTWNEITSLTANDGSYEWVIPDAVSDQCLIRVFSVDDVSIIDLSDDVFSIVAASTPVAAVPSRRTKPPAGPPRIIKK